MNNFCGNEQFKNCRKVDFYAEKQNLFPVKKITLNCENAKYIF